jgi:hypothetical protein
MHRAKYLSKKDSSTMLPELTEFVPATRMGIVRKVRLGLKNRAGCIFSLLLNEKLSVSMGRTIFRDINSNYAPV